MWSQYLQRPVDLPSWHEFDYSSIARNFLREGNNILFPRIDWRGDGPGFTEMEFPLQPWLTAQLYRAFGIHEWLERLIPFAATLLSLVVFGKLARLLLPQAAAFAAALFFAMNRTTLFVASAVQPEALMLLFYLLAAYCFLRWMEERSWWMFSAACAAFASAMLMKSPAAHLGIFFFLLLLQRYRFRLFGQWELWVFVLLSLAPVIVWYSHAYGLWHTYHNSMGVSNEDHWLGLDILRRPKVVLGLIGIEVLFVLGLGGAVAIAFSWASGIRQQPAVHVATLWLASILIYYVVILRTAGQYWAWYYHIVAVPPVALLLAAAAQRLQSRRASLVGAATACVALAAAFLATARRDWSSFPGVLQDLLTPRFSVATAACLTGVAVALAFAVFSVLKTDRLSTIKPSLGFAGTAVLAGALAAYFMVSCQLIRNSWWQFDNRSADYACINCFADKLAPGALIVSSGGICRDAAGHRVAGDSPEMFYWLDRKGFSTCEGQQSIEQLTEYGRRGAHYFIARKTSVRQQPAFEQSLKRTFTLLGECKTAWLFELRR